jgi:mono/diheme cytochrome c family protein
MKKSLLVFSLALLLGGFSAYQFYRGHAGQAQVTSEATTRLYSENCAACHGERGDGKGPEAGRLKTKPRDFTGGIYKFRSTPSGSLPLDEDIFRSISQGVRGTSMLAQVHLSERERWAVTEYLKTFSQRFKAEKTPESIAIPSQPPANAELIALGKRMYMDAGCAQCHGSQGRGDGASAKDLKDDWSNPISPTDLTMKPFKSGPNPEDLYRTISTGLNGTPMPSYAGVLTAKDRWSLALYIISIATRERPRGMMGLVGEEVQGMRIDMRAAMAGMMHGRGMMGHDGGMMDKNIRDRMNDMMGR